MRNSHTYDYIRLHTMLQPKLTADYFQVSLYIKYLAGTIFLDFGQYLCYHLYMMRKQREKS